jgi:glutamate-1-semialdehyde 2,1-aminomutase
LGLGGAQAKVDVRPDLTCFGKVIGGGLPIGAVGGRREIMSNLSPLGAVFHAGTLAGNPIATAAGLAVLNELTADSYMELSARARRLSAVLRDACAAVQVPAQFPVFGTLVGMHFGQALNGRAPSNFEEAKTTDESLFARVFHAALANGVAFAPGAYEALFVGLAHTDDVIDQIGEKLMTALAAVTRS